MPSTDQEIATADGGDVGDPTDVGETDEIDGPAPEVDELRAAFGLGARAAAAEVDLTCCSSSSSSEGFSA